MSLVIVRPATVAKYSSAKNVSELIVISLGNRNLAGRFRVDALICVDGSYFTKNSTWLEELPWTFHLSAISHTQSLKFV